MLCKANLFQKLPISLCYCVDCAGAIHSTMSQLGQLWSMTARDITTSGVVGGHRPPTESPLTKTTRVYILSSGYTDESSCRRRSTHRFVGCNPCPDAFRPGRAGADGFRIVRRRAAASVDRQPAFEDAGGRRLGDVAPRRNSAPLHASSRRPRFL